MVSYGFFSAMLVALVEGMFAYVLDRRVGVRIMYWWNGATSEKPPTDEQLRGLIYQQKAHTRLTVAVTITLVQNAFLFFSGTIHPFMAIVSIPFELAALMAGFYAGPLLDRFWTRKQPILDMIDKLESGETTVTQELKHAAESLRESLQPLNQLGKTIPDSRPTQNAVNSSPPASENKTEKPLAQQIEDDPLKYINDFIGRRKRDGSK